MTLSNPAGHVYLHDDNAEETLLRALELVKYKAYSDSRRQAFEDCTSYWKAEIVEILKGSAPSGAKLAQIRVLFGIEPVDE